MLGRASPNGLDAPAFERSEIVARSLLGLGIREDRQVDSAVVVLVLDAPLSVAVEVLVQDDVAVKVVPDVCNFDQTSSRKWRILRVWTPYSPTHLAHLLLQWGLSSASHS
jgi:hypothetical protein